MYSLTHLSITSLGYVKIHHLLPSDAGVYTCLAGQTREHLVLKIIGSKQKLSLPETAASWLFADGQQKPGQPDVVSRGETFQELPISLNHYDNIVERLFELRGSFQDVKDVDKLHLSEKNRSALEDERVGSEYSGPIVLIADSHKLDEITRNLSEEEQIAHLLSELTKTHSESNESTLHPPEGSDSSTQRPLLYKPNIKVHTPRPRRPVIIQQARRVGAVSSSEKIVHVGVPVLLQKPVASLELKCETLGNPQPTITWTKNRKELQYSVR